MLKKFIVGLVIGCSLVGSFVEAAPVKKRPQSTQNHNFKPGDVLAVQMNILGKTQIVLVYIHDNLSADYMYNGQLYPFPLVDLDNFVWAFYIKK